MDDADLPHLKKEMRIEVYANASKREVAVITDRPFQSKLIGLELNKQEGKLYFEFEDRRAYLGDTVQYVINSILQDHDIINVIQIDIDTKQVQGGCQVPLKIFE